MEDASYMFSILVEYILSVEWLLWSELMRVPNSIRKVIYGVRLFMSGLSK
jgi:hypothetical protein